MRDLASNIWIPTGPILATLLIPSLIMLITKWSGEFPFEGDYDHHTSASLVAAHFWKSSIWALPIAGLGAWMFKPLLRRFWPLAFLGPLLGWGYFVELPQFYFARYPAGSYFFSTPLIWLGQAMEWNAIINAPRLSSWLSLIAWLFILRPLFIKKPASWGFYAFAFLICLQKLNIHYFTSPYIEAWALIFILLGLELLLTQPKDSIKGYLFIAFATVFKEAAVLILPFAWIQLVAINSRDHKLKLTESVLVGIVSVIPFSIYFYYRISEKIWRKTEFANFADALSANRIPTALENLNLQFGISGLFLVGCFATCLFWIQKHQRQNLKLISIYLAAGVFHFLFFFFDKLTLHFPLYSRFQILVYTLFAIPLLFVNFENSKQDKVALTSILLLAIGLSSSGLQSLSLALKPSYYRNSLEAPRSPEHYPFRTLIKKAEQQNLLKLGNTVLINYPKQRFIQQSFQLGYRDLIKKYKWSIAPQSYFNPQCICRAASPIIFFPVVFDADNVKLKERDPKRKFAESKCLESLRKTCQKTIEEITPNNSLVGILGIYSP